jgi:hypothetical protein
MATHMPAHVTAGVRRAARVLFAPAQSGHAGRGWGRA